MSDSESVGSWSIPVKAGTIKKGSYVVVNDRPCCVAQYSTSKTGKHGHAKISAVVLDIFTGAKSQLSIQTTHNIEQPIITRKTYPLIDVQDDKFVSLLQDDSTLKEDLRLPGGKLGDDIEVLLLKKARIEVTVLSAMGIEQIIACKSV